MITVIYRTDDGQEFTELKDAIQYDQKDSKSYNVTLVFTGEYKTTVLAKDTQQAIQKALERVDMHEDVDYNLNFATTEELF